MSLFPEALRAQAETLMAQARAAGVHIATAESCTGGLIAALLTDIPGSSAVFTHGYITYANAAKTAMLGVPEALIQQHGAVSEHVAKAMAEGAHQQAGALAVAVTGIAGPGGGTTQKPVGLVHVAAANGKTTLHQRYEFAGDRSAIRLQSVEAALIMLQQLLQQS